MAKKMTKQDYVDGLSIIHDNFELPKEVQETILYNLKAYQKNKRGLTMEDINDTIEFLEEETNKKFDQYLAEYHGEEEVAEEKKEQVENSKKKDAEEDKKPLPKKENKKETKKDSDSIKHHLVNTEFLATFPEELVSETLGARLKLRLDIKDINDVASAYNNGQDIVLATYWTERHLIQYADSYDPMDINPNPPTKFENDLDLVEITFANELVVTGCSLYSYVPHTFKPADFTIYSDNMRYCNGMEFQVYEVVEVQE